jgi:uncharacterized protein (TIGR02271 family)
MIDEQQISAISGATVYDADGDKVGKAGEVYLDDATGRPEWLTVNTGLFGNHESFVPLEQATLNGDDVRVPFDKAKIKDAPRVATDGHLDPAEEEELYRYYGLSSAGQSGSGFEQGRSGTADTGMAAGTAGTSASDRDERRTSGHDAAGAASGLDDTNDHGTRGRDTSGPTTDDAMTLSKEELHVGTQTRQAGRARLRKYVVTERQSQTVPVSHEEVRLEREPITDANIGSATSGPAISEEEHEITLHEEVPVVSKEARPVERVRAATETVTGTEQVSEQVREERVDLDTDQDTTTGVGTDRSTRR